MEIDKAMHFADIDEWREWLENNHSIAGEAWLIIHKKNSKQTGIRYDEALGEAICFGWIDGKMQSIDKEKFVLKFSPRRVKSVWSKINRDKAEELIKSSRMREAGLLKIEEAKKNGNWDNAYTSAQPEEMPGDLIEALEKNTVAGENFYGFANSYKNMYIGWVNAARTEATRKRRIDEVVRRSRLNQKPGIM